MPRPHPPEFHLRAVELARFREKPVAQIAVGRGTSNIGIGRRHTHTPITLLTHDRDIRIINRDTGELPRHLTLNPLQCFATSHCVEGGP